MLHRIGKHLLTRLALVTAMVVGGASWRLSGPAPPEPSLAGLADMLGEAAAGRVDPDAVVWEPSGGPLRDPLVGRRVLFLASREGEPADLYRATVRVSREGRPISVARLSNLTATPLGSESGLVVRGDRVAFVTTAFESVQAATVLDLGGTRRRDGPLLDRLLLALDDWLWRGSLAGLGRTEVVFGRSHTEAKLELRDELLVMALGEPPRAAAADLTTGKVNFDGRIDRSTRVWTVAYDHRSRAELWASVLAGALGGERAKRLRSWWAGALRGEEAGADPVDAPTASSGAASWPPAVIPTSTDHPEDGHWKPPADWLVPQPTGLVGKATPPLLTTTTHPDGASALHLIVADTRQLELRFQSGQLSPRSQTGPGGSGRLPEAARAHAVAAFAGGLDGPVADGAAISGVLVGGRVLVPPSPGLATIAIDWQGLTQLGPWPGDDAVPRELMALRQSGEMLVREGQLHRGWADLRKGARRVERSAICRTAAGHLVYGWSPGIDARTLGRGMLLAGCRDAMHLAMHPSPAGLALLSPDRAPRALTEGMSFDASRLTDGSADDFFYLVLRSITPGVRQVDPEAATHDVEWEPDAGEQPPPAWLPAVHRGQTEVLGVKVALWAIEVDRFAWQIRPGDRERAGRTSAGPLETAELARAMVAISLGIGFRRTNRRGLVLDGMVALPIHGDRGVLASAPGGRLSIARSLDEMAPRGDASELLLLAAGGTMRSEAKRLGSRRARSAACMLPGRTMLLAIGRHDSSQPITRALLDLGCRRVVSLNRGVQVQGFVHRAGTGTPPRGNYDDTILYGMAKTASGRVQPL